MLDNVNELMMFGRLVELLRVLPRQVSSCSCNFIESTPLWRTLYDKESRRMYMNI